MNNLRNKFCRSFTLIEILLYLGLATFIMLAVVAFLALALTSQVKNHTASEVEQQGQMVTQNITQAIRNANLVNSPGQGSSAATISLNMLDGAKNPTIFDLAGGKIRVKEGSGSEVELTNNQVTASSLNFQNLSRDSTPGVVRITFTLSYVNPENRNEYDCAKTFRATASLR